MLVKKKISDKKIRGKHKTFDIIKGKIVNRKETRYEVNYIDKKVKIDQTGFLYSDYICDTDNREREKMKSNIRKA